MGRKRILPPVLSPYGQEKDSATSTLARMNMILHNNPTALIERGNTLSVPEFKDGGTLKTFDYVVANPPFSDKRWSTGIDPAKDKFERFKHFGVPPTKQGDYAYLLQIVRSLRSTGKGACILPHGPGPLRLSTRRETLHRLAVIQRESGFLLLSEVELVEIQRLWRVDGDMKDSAFAIWHDVLEATPDQPKNCNIVDEARRHHNNLVHIRPSED
jgi:hypothetical protein